MQPKFGGNSETRSFADSILILKAAVTSIILPRFQCKETSVTL